MRFDSSDRANSSQVDDRRGRSRAVGAGVGGLGLVGVVIAVVFQWMSGDRAGALQTAGEAVRDGVQNARESADPEPTGRVPGSLEGSCEGVSASSDHGKFSACVQNNVQEFWMGTLGGRYRPAKLVLFSDRTSSACGGAEAATGPFYCPGDEQVYIDLGFFKDLLRKLGAKGGDFAEAYVMAHEYGHHVQNLLGTERAMRRAQQRDKAAANALSVMMELQADCYAGVWGHAAFAAGKVEPGEIADALDAAAAVGDDRIQKAARGTVSPESFTHGSSADRQKWFRRGMDSGDYRVCDTFGTALQ